MRHIITTLEAPAAVHGEGICYEVHTDTLFWVDILGKKIFKYQRATQECQCFAMPEQIGFAIPMLERGQCWRLLCGLESGLAWFDLKLQQLHWLGNPEPDLPGNRFNDAKLDNYGRLWANTMDKNAQQVSGALYRCTLTDDNKQAECLRVDQGFKIGNGPTWSLLYDKMYHAETEKNQIFCYDFDAESGEVSNKQLFYTHHEAGMGPDGMQTDANGNVWVAMAHGGKLLQISPQGELMQEIALPTRFPTALTFLDSASTHMVVTTSQLDGVKQDPQAGLCLEVKLR